LKASFLGWRKTFLKADSFLFHVSRVSCLHRCITQIKENTVAWLDRR